MHHAHHSTTAASGVALTLDESSGCSMAQRDLQLILREIQFITNKMRRNEEEQDIISDWKFAAIVMDRFCLIVFTLFTIVATLVVLLSAPHIIVQ
jgi:nicotinic acetylcholine receptor